MSKVNTLSELAERINKLGYPFIAKEWEKGGKQRIYLTGVGYNTKKMRTDLYISLESGIAEAHCYIECPAQPANWIATQQKKCIESVAGIVYYCNDYFSFSPVGESIEVVMNNALLDAEEVKGFYTEWRTVRVPINRFGRLATKQRQFVLPFQGTKNTAPATFQPLSDIAYDYLKGQKEIMLNAYQAIPDIERMAALYRNN